MTRTPSDGLGANPFHLLSAALRSVRQVPDWIHAEGKKVIHTYQGRNAIALFCRMVGLEPGDEVLAPAYNCGAEIDPFVKAGARVILYDVDCRLGIDVDRIARSITRATRIVYVTHFFGFAQPLEELKEACRIRNVLLVEDCAQALFSTAPNGRMGLTGDAAVFSFVKTLPTPDGGALVVDRHLVRSEPRLLPPPLKATIRACLPLVKRWLVNSAPRSTVHRLSASLVSKRAHGVTASSDSHRHPPMLPSNHFIEKQAGWGVSRVSNGILQSSNAEDIVRTRRRNFGHLLDALVGIPGFAPVITALPPGVSPIAFPFLAAERSHWYAQLEARGILVQGWPGYYPGFDWDAYPEACHLKDKLLTLPVHQGLGLAHMEYVAESVREVARLAPGGLQC